MVSLNNHSIVPGEWTITGFKLEQLNVTYEGVLDQYSRSSYLMAGPVLYDGQFSLPTNEEPKHTYLNTDGWGKVRCTDDLKVAAGSCWMRAAYNRSK